MKWSVRNKLVIGFAITLVMLIASAMYMTWQMRDVNARLGSLVDFSSQKINLSNEIMIEMLQAGRQEKNLLLDRNQAKKKDYVERIEISLRRIDEKVNELKTLTGETGRQKVEEFEILWNNYKPVLNEIISLSLKNEDEKAFDLSIELGQRTRDDSIILLGQLIEKNEQDMLNDKISSDRVYDSTVTLNVIFVLIVAFILVGVAFWITRSISSRISFVSAEALRIAGREFSGEYDQDKAQDELTPVFNSLQDIRESFREIAGNSDAVASGNYEVEIAPKSEKDVLGHSLKKMTQSLRETSAENEKINWLTIGRNMLNEQLIGEQNMEDLATQCATFLSGYVNASIGAVYLADEDQKSLRLIGRYAFSSGTDLKFDMGEGLIGQVARQQKPLVVSDIDDNHIRIMSTVMDARPDHLLVAPFVFEGKTLGVVELGKIKPFTETEMTFVYSSMESVGIIVNSALAKDEINRLLLDANEKGRQLANAKHEIEQQLEGLNDVALVSITDADGNITYVNDRFVQVSKFDREELVGQNHRILKSGKQPDGLFTGMWKAITIGRVWNGEIINRAKDGSYYWVDTTIIPIMNIDGKLERFLSVRFEITKIKEQQEAMKRLNDELQEQQEELKQLNEELEEQTQNLKQQQEELQATNEELEEQTQALELKNREVERARREIEYQTKRIEQSSRYKSEFLANMSHELRTPLNSLLILSKDLADNRQKNLTPDQVESAEIIYKGGNDLLMLINEVLDLAKIEAGKMPLHVEPVHLKPLADELMRTFRHQAEQKNLSLKLEWLENAPRQIITDLQRLNQILKNLLSNAIKFTHKGEVRLTFRGTDGGRVSISVSDTGIGIPESKQKVIFEAFQQGEGGTSRKYGGTGLGLSISRELSRLLSGEIAMESKVGEGSVFTLTLPAEISAQENETEEPNEYSGRKVQRESISGTGASLDFPLVEDDRSDLAKEDLVILIIDDDIRFAEILRNQARQKGFKALVSANGEEGLQMARQYLPHAIILDLALPGKSGQEVLASLKSDMNTRHIPVHIVSVEERSLDLIREGAVEFLTKPVYKDQLDAAFSRIRNFIAREVKNLLIVEDDENSRKAIKKLIGNGDVVSLEASSGQEALDILKTETVDCIILDLILPDISGFEIIRELEKSGMENVPPIIVYTGKELSKEENDELQKYAESIIIKGVKSEERLLDETALFLHRTISRLPESKQQLISSLYDKERVFQGKKILLVDDDMRNLFALSKVLKEYAMDVIKAENGLLALEMLAKNPDVDMVLMDIMMPEMDGYEAMRKIREQSAFADLPIIALTAKAMKDDKQKCLDAGASEYISKPVDIQRLISLMRVWLNK